MTSAARPRFAIDPSVRSRLPALVAAAAALAPALVWAATAGPRALGWHGLAMISGFASAGLFAVSMLLMLRSTWLDRVFRGLGHVYEAHHALGTAAFVLLLLHPLALALSALRSHPAGALGVLWPDPSSPVVFAGWLALLLFIAFFVVTVTPTVPRRVWMRFHRASGLAYAAMIWHLIAGWTGSVGSALALGLVVAGVLGYGHRLLAQDTTRVGLHYRIARVHRRGPKVVDLVLDPLGKKLRFEAGQFVYLALRESPTYHACGELHPYTLTGSPDDPQLHLSIKALGQCSRHIQDVSPGVEAIVQGPFGRLFPARSRHQSQIWIAGGVGITPFLSRAASLPYDEPSVDLVYTAPTEGAALYLDDLRELARQRPSLRIHALFDDRDGLPTAAAVEARVGSFEGREVVLAGPPAMVSALGRGLRARGVPARRIHTEEGLLR